MTDDNPYASPAADQITERRVGELEPPQSVEFSLALDDTYALFDHLHATNPSVRRFLHRQQRRLYVVAGVFGLIGILCLAEGDGLEFIGVMSILSAVGFAGAGVRLPANARKNSRALGKEMAENESAYLLDRPYTATLFDEGVQVTDCDGHWFRYWRALPSVVSTDSMLIIYRTPSQAIGVPSHTFFDEAAFNAFCRLAERLWREAKQEAESAHASTPTQ